MNVKSTGWCNIVHQQSLLLLATHIQQQIEH